MPQRRWPILGLGYALLLAAWIVGNPPSAVPDEPANLIRAVGVGQGDLDGAAGRYEPGVLDYLTAPQRAFVEEQSRSFVVPDRLRPIDPGCFAFRPEQSAACLPRQVAPGSGSTRLLSPVGTYPPLAYLPAGLAMKVAADPAQASLIGRAASALPCLLLLLAAMWLLDRGPSRWPLATAVLATTPLITFFASGVNPSGLELCAALCFAAGLVAVAGGRQGPLVWAVLAASGALFASSRPASFALAAAVVVAALPILPWSSIVRQGRGPALAALTVAAAALAAVLWATAHQPRVQTDSGALPGALAHVLSSALPLARQMVGIFGWGDTPLPGVLYVAWWAAAGLVVLSAALLSDGRERAAAVLAAGAVIALAAALYGLVLQPHGQDLHGRYLVPVAVFIPLLAGLVLARSDRLGRWGPPAVGVLMAALQLGAVWYTARRNAVGRHGPGFFLPVAQWSPPGGWLPMLAMAAAGALLLVIALLPSRSAGQLSAP